MLQNILISSQTNGAFSKNPKGIHESEQSAGDFQSAFAAAAAARKNTDGYPQGISKGNNGGKVDCNGECESLEDQDSLVQSESPESERSDELFKDLEEETKFSKPLPVEEDPQQAVVPDSLVTFLGGEQTVQNMGVSEGMEREINQFGNPKIPRDLNVQNPIKGKEKNIHEKAPLTESKQGNKILHIQPDSQKKAPLGFGNIGTKLQANETEPQSAAVKSTLKFDGEKGVNSENVEIRHAKQSIENFNTETVKTSQLGATADDNKENAPLKPSRDLDSPWTGPLKKSGKFSYGQKPFDEADRSKESKKTILSSKRSSIGTIATAKDPIATGKDENGSAFISQRGRKGDAAQEGNGAASKQKMKINAVTGNAMNAGDSGSVSKNVTPPSDLTASMKSIPGEGKILEKSDQHQKDSSLKTENAASRFVNVPETETKSSKPGSDGRESQGDTGKQNRFQGKDFHGTLEKIEVTKGEDLPPVPKARYGSNNGATPVNQEPEQGIQKSPTGKENLGSLVRTTAFLLKNGRQEAKMALHPESLGHLKIRIVTENQQVTVKVMAETVVAKEMLEHNLHQLKTDFQNQGLEISKFDVSLSQDSDRNGAGQNPSFNSNRTKDKAGLKKEGNPRQSEETEQTASNANGVRHDDAVDFFA